MKTLNFLRCVLGVGLMTLAICQSARAVAAPAQGNKQWMASALIDQKLKRVDSELKEISAQMEIEKDGRKGKIQNLQKKLESLSQEPANREKKYCDGKIAWALHEECPE